MAEQQGMNLGASWVKGPDGVYYVEIMFNVGNCRYSFVIPEAVALDVKRGLAQAIEDQLAAIRNEKNRGSNGHKLIVPGQAL